MNDWRKEKAAVEDALASLLPALDRPHLSLALGFRLAGITGLSEKRCRTILGWLAKEGHPHATRDGGVVQSYGRSVVRWRWHPAPQRAAPALSDETDAEEARLWAIGPDIFPLWEDGDSRWAGFYKARALRLGANASDPEDW